MSSEQVAQLLKQLVKQLDIKFDGIDRRLDRLESQIDNFRAFHERSIQQLQSSFSESVKKERSFVQSAPRPKTKPGIKSSIKTSTPEINIPKEDIKPLPSTPPPIKLTESSSKTTTLYGGMKETPILAALKSEPIDASSESESFYEVQAKRKNIQKETLRNYLDKLEKVIRKSWPLVQTNIDQGDNQGYIDKSLTVLHGIIEFLFVAYRREFPDPSLDYYAKAKNISGLGLFKDVSLLEKMETIYQQMQNKESVILAKPLLRGWYERLTKVFSDFEERVTEVFYE